jgi:hypothetical protein
MQLAPRERVVERRHDHHRGRTGRFRVHAQLDGLARGQRAGAGDDGDAAGGRLHRGLTSSRRSRWLRRGELAGAPAGHEPGGAGADQAVDDLGERAVVDRCAVLGERCDERGQHSVKGLRHG